jgi:glutaredoxin
MDYHTYNQRVLCPFHGMLQVLSLLLVTTSLQAGIYTWQDAQGRTHFGDRPPAESQASQLKLRINTYTSPEIKPLSSFISQHDPTTVIIYSTQWCGVCKKAKRYFKEKKIPYEEYDVEHSEKGKRDFKRLQGTGVPILLVG